MWAEQGMWFTVAMLMVPGFSLINRNPLDPWSWHPALERADETPCVEWIVDKEPSVSR